MSPPYTAAGMHTSLPSPSFFEGLPAEDVARILGRLERRRFTAASIILAEGDAVEEMYIVQDGLAEVMIADRHGAEHLLSRIGSGGAPGGKAPVLARAGSGVEVLVFTRGEFEQVADSLPVVYRNLGAILSRRLSRTNSRWLRAYTGRI